MSGHYLDGDTVDRSLDYLKQGGSLDDLAARLHFEPGHLARLLGLQSQPVTQADDDSCDLWAADGLDGVL